MNLATMTTPSASSHMRQELDVSIMDAAKPMPSGSTARKFPHCKATIPMQANFHGDCV